ncbi:MAG: DUF6785 family protein [Candidatus Brocadiia bacterium]
MSWKAFFIGLVFVGIINLITPYNDFDLANTYMTGFHFPVGAFFLLVLFTLGCNTLLKLVRKAWAFKQQELMLVWCMMIIGSTVPSSGLMRYLHPMIAAPSYYASGEEYQDWTKEGHLLSRTPDALVLSTGNDPAINPRAKAAQDFYGGTSRDEELSIPWRHWARPLVAWGIFLLMFYLSIFFMCAILRGRWVDAERLSFPLAKVPLELTEDSSGKSLFPSLVSNPYFLVGVGISLVFGFVRLFAIETVQIKLWRITSGTFLEQGHINVAYVFPLAIGFAFLLPAQISFSFWFFWLFSRFEYIAAYQAGSPITQGDYGPFMQWQQAGAFVAFTAVILWKARKHIAKVARKAFGAGSDVDDSDEPVGFKLAFWGFILCCVGQIAWFLFFAEPAGISEGAREVFSLLLLLAFIFSLLLVHARLVAQGGLFFTQQNWAPVQVVHGITGGYGLSAPALVMANMQHAMLMSDAREVLSPHAMNAFRITSIFKKKKRLFMPAMLAALLLALLVAGWSSMRVFYSTGANNVSNGYGPRVLAPNTFKTAEKMIMEPESSADMQAGAGIFGAVFMVGVLAVRMRFHWWPVHPIGFLVATTYMMGTMWLSFMIGWFIKTLVMYFGGGRGLRRARIFFLGIITMEAFWVGTCAVLGFLLKQKIGGYIFLPG